MYFENLEMIIVYVNMHNKLLKSTYYTVWLKCLPLDL